MSNMGYCRFENTLAALRECRDWLAENSNPLMELSESESYSATRLFALCRELADDFAETAE